MYIIRVLSHVGRGGAPRSTRAEPLQLLPQYVLWLNIWSFGVRARTVQKPKPRIEKLGHVINIVATVRGRRITHTRARTHAISCTSTDKRACDIVRFRFLFLFFRLSVESRLVARVQYRAPPRALCAHHRQRHVYLIHVVFLISCLGTI